MFQDDFVGTPNDQVEDRSGWSRLLSSGHDYHYIIDASGTDLHVQGGGTFNTFLACTDQGHDVTHNAQWAEIVLTASPVPSTSHWFCVCRGGASADTYFYGVYIRSSDKKYVISGYGNSDGLEFLGELAVSVNPAQTGDTVALEASGAANNTTLRLYVNGTLSATVTGNNTQGGTLRTRQGFRSYYALASGLKLAGNFRADSGLYPTGGGGGPTLTKKWQVPSNAINQQMHMIVLGAQTPPTSVEQADIVTADGTGLFKVTATNQALVVGTKRLVVLHTNTLGNVNVTSMDSGVGIASLIEE